MHVHEKNLFMTLIDCLVEVVYYLKQVIHLLYEKGDTPAEEGQYFVLVIIRGASFPCRRFSLKCRQPFLYQNTIVLICHNWSVIS